MATLQKFFKALTSAATGAGKDQAPTQRKRKADENGFPENLDTVNVIEPAAVRDPLPSGHTRVLSEVTTDETPKESPALSDETPQGVAPSVKRARRRMKLSPPSQTGKSSAVSPDSLLLASAPVPPPQETPSSMDECGVEDKTGAKPRAGDVGELASTPRQTMDALLVRSGGKGKGKRRRTTSPKSRVPIGAGTPEGTCADTVPQEGNVGVGAAVATDAAVEVQVQSSEEPSKGGNTVSVLMTSKETKCAPKTSKKGSGKRGRPKKAEQEPAASAPDASTAASAPAESADSGNAVAGAAKKPRRKRRPKAPPTTPRAVSADPTGGTTDQTNTSSARAGAAGTPPNTLCAGSTDQSTSGTLGPGTATDAGGDKQTTVLTATSQTTSTTEVAGADVAMETVVKKKRKQQLAPLFRKRSKPAPKGAVPDITIIDDEADPEAPGGPEAKEDPGTKIEDARSSASGEPTPLPATAAPGAVTAKLSSDNIGDAPMTDAPGNTPPSTHSYESSRSTATTTPTRRSSRQRAPRLVYNVDDGAPDNGEDSGEDYAAGSGGTHKNTRRGRKKVGRKKQELAPVFLSKKELLAKNQEKKAQVAQADFRADIEKARAWDAAVKREWKDRETKELKLVDMNVRASTMRGDWSVDSTPTPYPTAEQVHVHQLNGTPDVPPATSTPAVSAGSLPGCTDGRVGMFRMRVSPLGVCASNRPPMQCNNHRTQGGRDDSELCALLGGTVRSVFAERAARAAAKAGAPATPLLVIDDDDDDTTPTRPILTADDLKARGCTCKESLSLYAKQYQPRAVEARQAPEVSAGQLWTERYMPTSKAEVIGNTNAVGSLGNWLTQWKVLQNIENRDKKADEKRKKKKGSTRRRQRIQQARRMRATTADGTDTSSESSSEESDSDDDFVPDVVRHARALAEAATHGDGLGNTMLLVGPPGSGKTAAVYACATELGYNVLELHAGQIRTGRVLLGTLAEATQSHQVTANAVAKDVSSAGSDAGTTAPTSAKSTTLLAESSSGNAPITVPTANAARVPTPSLADKPKPSGIAAMFLGAKRAASATSATADAGEANVHKPSKAASSKSKACKKANKNGPTVTAMGASPACSKVVGVAGRSIPPESPAVQKEDGTQDGLARAQDTARLGDADSGPPRRRGRGRASPAARGEKRDPKRRGKREGTSARASEQDSNQAPTPATQRRGTSRLAAKGASTANNDESEDHDGGVTYVTIKDNETPREIAKIIGCDCATLVAQNRKRYPGIRPGSKLRPGTTLTFHPDDETHQASDEEVEPSMDADVAAAVQAAGLDLSQFQGGGTAADGGIAAGIGLSLAKASLILIEDVDVAFEEDTGYWKAIEQLMRTTKKPIVLTTSSVPTDVYLNRKRYRQLRFRRPLVSTLVRHAQLLMLAEGRPVCCRDLYKLVMHRDRDMRAVITALQLWTVGCRATAATDDHCFSDLVSVPLSLQSPHWGQPLHQIRTELCDKAVAMCGKGNDDEIADASTAEIPENPGEESEDATAAAVVCMDAMAMMLETLSSVHSARASGAVSFPDFDDRSVPHEYTPVHATDGDADDVAMRAWSPADCTLRQDTLAAVASGAGAWLRHHSAQSYQDLCALFQGLETQEAEEAAFWRTRRADAANTSVAVCTNTNGESTDPGATDTGHNASGVVSVTGTPTPPAAPLGTPPTGPTTALAGLPAPATAVVALASVATPVAGPRPSDRNTPLANEDGLTGTPVSAFLATVEAVCWGPGLSVIEPVPLHRIAANNVDLLCKVLEPMLAPVAALQHTAARLDVLPFLRAIGAHEDGRKKTSRSFTHYLSRIPNLSPNNIKLVTDGLGVASHHATSLERSLSQKKLSAIVGKMCACNACNR
eukprot:m.1352613 g.1352613  ORF g.1352613 m.1352613 type:complete len:1861 (+) comp24926_c0_seq2:287-5869(+)